MLRGALGYSRDARSVLSCSMDLPSITTYLRPQQWDDLRSWQPDWAWLAGGTWLFSEPQPQVRTLVDMQALGWSELILDATGLTIGATCTMRQLLNLSGTVGEQAPDPATWPGLQALQAAVRELASFKIHNQATIAGNLCLALPASTFAPACLVLRARYEIWPRQGSPYWLAADEFQQGAQQTCLQPGDVLRRIHIPASALAWETNYQRLCLADAGIALAIAVAAYDRASGQVSLGLGASFPAPRRLDFAAPPPWEQVQADIQALPLDLFLEDAAASAVYRRQMTAVLAGRALMALLREPPGEGGPGAP